MVKHSTLSASPKASSQSPTLGQELEERPEYAASSVTMARTSRVISSVYSRSPAMIFSGAEAKGRPERLCISAEESTTIL